MPSLIKLVRDAGLDAHIEGDESVTISSITADSRQVQPGALFAALGGTQTDGTQFIADAVSKGAKAIMVRRNISEAFAVSAVQVDEVRGALARMAAAFYAKQPEHLVAITGTNGKTSTAEFYRQIWALEGSGAASIGTMGLRSNQAALDANYPANNTSPEPVLLAQTLASLVDANVQYVAVEASSHGLDQHRLDGVKIEAAAYTNISRDHLDYHASMDEYFAAKAKLFSDLQWSGKVAVINADDTQAEALIALCQTHGREVRSYGKKGAYLTLHNVQPTAEGLQISLTVNGSVYEGVIPQYGVFQAYNLCAALLLAEASGMAMQQALAHLPKLQGVRGRMEWVANHPNGAPIFVDYAHTPDALETVLKSLRTHTDGKLHAVFGCGGNRDAGKRPLMGNVAAEYADVAIVTDDNPRNENPEDIRAAIMAAIPAATEIGDRAEAIRTAIAGLKKGDALVVAGKGHETYQIVGGISQHFDDAEQIREAVGAL